MHSRWMGLILGACLLAFLSVSVGCEKEVEAGPLGPDFALPDLSGQVKTLSGHRGSIVILDFWATWCPPCRMSIPELVALQKKYRSRGLVILGVSMDDPERTSNQHLRAFKKRYKINYAILRPNERIMLDYFGHFNPAIPTMFLIDREGRIRDKLVGFKAGALEKALTGLFN